MTTPLRFPDAISYGATSAPGFNTEVVTVKSGGEKRNALWSTPLYTFEAAHGIKTEEQFKELLDFFMEKAKGKLNPFRFRNWAEYFITTDISYVTRPATNTLKLWKKYGDYNRRITKIVDGTFKIYADGKEIKSNFEVDIETGIVTLGNPSTYPTTTVFTYECEFDFWCRFDSDQMFVSMNYYNVYDWNQIPLVEVRQADPA